LIGGHVPVRFWDVSQWFIDMTVYAFIPVVPVATGFDKNTKHRIE